MNTDDEPQAPPDVVAPTYTISRADGCGNFKLQRNLNYWEDSQNQLVEDLSNEATASFKLTAADSVSIDIGVVACQYKILNFLSNKTYAIDGTAASGMNFVDTTGVFWTIEGNVSLGVPALSYTTQKPMPVYYGVTNFSIPATITRSAGFQIPLGANIKHADSIFVSLTVGEKSVSKIIGGFASKCVFTNTELSTLVASNGKKAKLQVLPINYDLTTVGGRKTYITNQASYTKIVEVK